MFCPGRLQRLRLLSGDFASRAGWCTQKPVRFPRFALVDCTGGGKNSTRCFSSPVFNADEWDQATIDAQAKEIDEYCDTQRAILSILEFARQTKSTQFLNLFGPTVNRQCPQLLSDFPPERWPIGIPVDFATKVLQQAHLNGQCAAWAHDVSLRTDQDVFYEERHMVKRWHGIARRALAFDRRRRGKLHLGDLVELPDQVMDAISYLWEADHRSSYSNNPNISMDLELGSTHVALGFNDLDALLCAQIAPAKDEDGYRKPLKFVGYEKSPFSIAKYKVIAEMLRSNTDVSSILQVWYSSTWTTNTVDDFRRCCQSVLLQVMNSKNDEGRSPKAGNRNNQVKEYLTHWTISKTISAEEARRNWFLYTAAEGSDSFLGGCNFVRSEDRAALTRYFLTGEVFSAEDQHDTTLVGSVTMWNAAPGFPPMLKGDTITNTVFLESLIEERNRNAGEGDVVNWIVNIKSRQICHLRELVMKQLVEIELQYGNLEPVSSSSGQDLACEIGALKASTVSWSNLVDYFKLSDFHDLARALSGPTTKHYGYSMNWPTVVYGAEILDYESVDERKMILDECYEKTSSTGEQSSALIVVPFFQNPVNLAGYSLAPKFYPHWLDQFVKSSIDSSTNLMESHIALKHPLLRSPRTLYLKWTYDGPKCDLSLILFMLDQVGRDMLINNNLY